MQLSPASPSPKSSAAALSRAPQVTRRHLQAPGPHAACRSDSSISKVSSPILIRASPTAAPAGVEALRGLKRSVDGAYRQGERGAAIGIFRASAACELAVARPPSAFTDTGARELALAVLPAGSSGPLVRPGGLGEDDEAHGSSKLQAAALRMRCLLYTSPSPRDQRGSRMPSSA